MYTVVNSRQGSDLKRRITGTIIKSADENSLKPTLGKGRREARGATSHKGVWDSNPKWLGNLKQQRTECISLFPFFHRVGNIFLSVTELHVHIWSTGMRCWAEFYRYTLKKQSPNM